MSTVYYVRKTGSDTLNNGLSNTNAFATINKALTVCSSDSIIYIGAGIYSDEIQYMTKSNISLIGDTSGINTGDKGLIIIRQSKIHQFNECTGVNFTIKNIISSTTGSCYTLYNNNNTAKFINCIFSGLNSYGISSNGFLYNCTATGQYTLARNMGAPQKAVNCIFIGICESGTNVNFQNCYQLPVGTDIFVDKSNNNYRVKKEYESNVKNLGVSIADVPTTDIIGIARQTPPWIGAYDVEIKNLFLIKQNSNFYSINSTNYDSTTSHNFIPLTLAGGTTPNKSDIETLGFNDLNLLTNSMTVNSDIFIPVLKFDNTAELKLYKG